MFMRDQLVLEILKCWLLKLVCSDLVVEYLYPQVKLESMLHKFSLIRAQRNLCESKDEHLGLCLD